MYRFCSQREVEICQLENPVLKQFMPAIYHILLDDSKVVFITYPGLCVYTLSPFFQELYVVMMEYLSKESVCLLDTVDDVSVWGTDNVKVLLI